jgi:thiol:disulfide interchange protein DsbD
MRIIKLFFLFLITATSYAQIDNPVKWTSKTNPNEVKIGETIELIFEAKIQEGWHMFSSDFSPDLGPIVATFTFAPNASYELVGKIKPIKPLKKYDDIFQGDYTYFEHKGIFIQKVKILKANPVINCEFKGQSCTNDDGKCVPLNEDFEFTNIKVIGESAGTTETTQTNKTKKIDSTTTATQTDTLASQKDTNTTAKTATASTPTKTERPSEGSIWELIFVAFMGGLVALITPCVFPMIPMTVTFFLKSSKSKSEAIKKALIYGFSIIAIYAILGLAFSKIFGPDAPNIIATHWFPNVLFFVVFFIFGISFLGAFEIMIPTSLVNKVDSQADQGGLLGLFFMAFAIVLVTFSCTGPIVGSVLVLASDGKILKPVVGMISYASAFAIPFTLFAMFPSWLSKLPKSGGWLNVVKVTLGFIELALGLKFLSVADQVYHWHLLDRHVYIALWIIIFILLGFYLLGKIRMPHDSPVEKTSVGRLLLSIVSFTFAMYLFPGMFGAPLSALSGYLPPLSTHNFDIPSIIRTYSAGEENVKSASTKLELCETPKYADKLHLPHGLKGYFDYQQALKCAKELNKPLFIDFTGHGCVNCREMEANVWADPVVLNMLRNDFLVVALYVDEPTALPESEIFVSTYDGKKKKNIGSANADHQITKFNNNAQPYYVLLDPFTEKPLANPIGYEKSVPEFVKYLEAGKNNFIKPHN